MSWLTILRAATGNLAGIKLRYIEPKEQFVYLEEVLGKDFLVCSEWRKLYNEGIHTRQQLLNSQNSDLARHPFIAEVLKRVQTQRERSEVFSQAATDYAAALEVGKELGTLSIAIPLFRRAAKSFMALGLHRMAVGASLQLGSALCNRAWKRIPGLVNLQDAEEAEEILTRCLKAIDNIDAAERPLKTGQTLSWRTRVRTLLADRDKVSIEGALADGKKAVNLLSKIQHDGGTINDLADAYQHLARVYFWLGKMKASNSMTRVVYFYKAKRWATRSVEIATNAGTKSEARWLLEHA